MITSARRTQHVVRNFVAQKRRQIARLIRHQVKPVIREMRVNEMFPDGDFDYDRD